MFIELLIEMNSPILLQNYYRKKVCIKRIGV